MRSASALVLASTNRHKFEEISTLWASLTDEPLKSVTIAPASDFLRNADKLGLAEKFNSFEENVIAKARMCNMGCHYPSLADDSGLEVMALEGAPGVKSHRYAIAKAGQTQDQANIEKLLAALQGKTDRRARFVCHLALVMEGVMITAKGFLEGNIAEKASGTQGFGYDPIFIPNGASKTLAEYTRSEKNVISHRAQALRQMVELIQQQGVVLAKP